MNKIAILGDPHFGVRGDSLDFHEYFKRYYEEHFFPTLKELGINLIIQLGDMFDRRKFINIHTLYLARKYFFDRLVEDGISMITILGNHDIYFKDTLEVNSPSLLLQGYPIQVIQEPTTINLGGREFQFFPWNTYQGNGRGDICIGHFEISNFQVSVGNEFKGGLRAEDFSGFNMVLSGHFHHRSSNGNIYYLGTPTENTWGDYNDLRGFHILDTTDLSLEFHENPLRMFHKVFYDDTSQDGEYWDSHPYSQYLGCYVKLVVVNRTNPGMFDRVLTSLEESGLADLKVIENASHEYSEEVDQSEDTMTIVGRYVDTYEAPETFDKQVLKGFLHKIYNEALSRQGRE